MRERTSTPTELRASYNVWKNLLGIIAGTERLLITACCCERCDLEGCQALSSHLVASQNLQNPLGIALILCDLYAPMSVLKGRMHR